MPDTTPTYIAYCPECEGLLGASVADPASPDSLGRAVKDYRMWQRRGLRLEIKTVQDVRDHKPPLGHTETCGKAKRKPKQARFL